MDDNTCATTSGDVFWKILEMPESLIMVFMVVSILIGRGKGEFGGDGFVFERIF